MKAKRKREPRWKQEIRAKIRAEMETCRKKSIDSRISETMPTFVDRFRSMNDLDKALFLQRMDYVVGLRIDHLLAGVACELVNSAFDRTHFATAMQAIPFGRLTEFQRWARRVRAAIKDPEAKQG